MNRWIALSLFALFFLPLFPVSADDKARQWTSADGKVLSAVLEDFDGSSVKLRTTRGVYTFPLERLSEADQAYLQKWKENAPLTIGPWPDKVEVPNDLQIEDVSEGDSYVYHSPHFEFRSSTRLSKTVVQEFARIFEATYLGVEALPVGFDPMIPKEGHFLTELFPDSGSYMAAGGMPGSAGMFRWQSRGGEYVGGKIMVPMTSLGVEKVGQRYIVDHDRESGTLIHEIAHQVTVRWGVLRAPVWFTEGIAEYMQSAPYSKGRMRFTDMPRAVEAQVMKYSRDNEFWMVSLDRLMTMSHEQWQSSLAGGSAGQNYNSANVLMTYFLHFDGPGNGEPIAAYLRALRAGTKPDQAMADHLLRERSFDELQESLDKTWKGLRVSFQ